MDDTDARALQDGERPGVQPTHGRIRWRKVLLRGGIGLVVLFGLIQAVPYGRSHSNPPVLAEPRWDSQATRALAARACFDCHSNLTQWRWYSNVAPVSWLVQNDVSGGRSSFNFSEWNKPQDTSIGDIVEAIQGGSMPPWFYTIMHGSASLTSAEKNSLIRGLQATFASSPPVPGGG